MLASRAMRGKTREAPAPSVSSTSAADEAATIAYCLAAAVLAWRLLLIMRRWARAWLTETEFVNSAWLAAAIVTASFVMSRHCDGLALFGFVMTLISAALGLLGVLRLSRAHGVLAERVVGKSFGEDDARGPRRRRGGRVIDLTFSPDETRRRVRNSRRLRGLQLLMMVS